MNNKATLQVFLDLDGVFADFDKRVKHLTGKHPNQLTRDRLWKMVNSDKRFFAELELIEGCMVLWEATRDLEPIFLTGAPSAKVFQEQKKEWVARIFGPDTVRVLNRDDAAVARMTGVGAEVVTFGTNEPTEAGAFGLLNERGVLWLAFATPSDVPEKKRKKGGKGPAPVLVVGAALVAGIVLAKVVAWRGHAHPRD